MQPCQQPIQRTQPTGCPEFCRCKRCLSRDRGEWFAAIGAEVGGWKLFTTITFRKLDDHADWNNVAFQALDNPTPAFARHSFKRFVAYLEHEIGSPVAFVVADQYGQNGGRLHLHALLAGQGLDAYPRREIEAWLGQHIGFSRVLPYQEGAAYYLSRFIDTDDRTTWDIKIKPEKPLQSESTRRVGIVTAKSDELPQECYRRALRVSQRNELEAMARMTNDSREGQQGDQRKRLHRQRREQIGQVQGKEERRARVFHIDGSGMRPDGTGSGYSRVEIKTGEQRICRVDNLTNNEAEYRALILVLKHLDECDQARVLTDSQLVVQQFNGRFKVKDQKLIRLLERVRELIEEKALEVEVRWIPRGENVAGKVLERQASMPKVVDSKVKRKAVAAHVAGRARK